MSSFNEIAEEAERQINELAGDDRSKFIEGLEEVLGFLETALMASREDEEREQEEHDDGS